MYREKKRKGEGQIKREIKGKDRNEYRKRGKRGGQVKREIKVKREK